MPRNPLNQRKKDALDRDVPMYGPSLINRNGRLYKRCTDCERVLPVTSFGQRTKSKTSWRSVCRECAVKRERARRQTIREEEKQWTA